MQKRITVETIKRRTKMIEIMTKEIRTKEMMTKKIPLLLVVSMMIMKIMVTITIRAIKRRTKMEIKEEPLILKNPMKRWMI
jgi:hypothetical protein